MIDFHPSVKKFMVWDGEQLRGPLTIGDVYEAGVADGRGADSDVAQGGALAFTGLHDADGREVYEGHIVAYRFHEMGAWREEHHAVRFQNGAWMIANILLHGREFRIVGHVYTHPELVA